MAMKGSFQAVNPDSIEFSMTITMSLGEWKAIKKMINATTSNQWLFISRINSMVEKAEREFSFYESEVSESG